MSRTTLLVRKIFSSPLSRQYLTWIFFFGTVLSLIITTTEIYSYYQRLHNQLEGDLERISSTYIEALGNSIWEHHDAQAQLIMDGITLDNHIRAVEVKDDKLYLSSGDVPSNPTSKKIEKPIHIEDFGVKQHLGKFVVFADLNWLHQQVYNFAIARLLNNLTKSIIVILFAFFAFWVLVNKHLEVISTFVSSGKTLKYPIEQLHINRQGYAYKGWDEIDEVIAAINQFGKELDIHINKIVTMTRESEIVNLRLLEAMRMESIGKHASSITHEFNNSLAIISGAIELISANQGLPDEVRDRLKVARTSVDAASTLTRQLLGYSRKKTASISLLKMDDFSVELEGILSVLVGKKNDITVSCTTRLGLFIHKELLLLSIINLVKNANEALEKDGKIRVTIKEAAENPKIKKSPRNNEKYIEISVIDNGPGLTSEIQQKIFEPFMSTKYEQNGTGLGLWTVYNFIKQLSGQVGYHYTDEGGSNFKLTIPVNQTAPSD